MFKNESIQYKKKRSFAHDWAQQKCFTNNLIDFCKEELLIFKGAVSRNSAKLGNYKMPVKLRET